MSSVEILDSMSLRSKQLLVPIGVTVELTTRCNERCIHCYIADHNRPELTFDEICSLLDDLKRSGTFYLTLTGGEVLVRDDFVLILREARRLRLSVTVFTNATLMTSAIANEMRALGVHSVGVSVYSTDSHIHDSITTVKGSWEKTMRGIDCLQDAGIPLVIKCPVMNANYRTFRKVAVFSKEIGAELQMSPTITVMDDGNSCLASHRIAAAKLDSVIREEGILEKGAEPIAFANACDTVPCTAVFNGGAIDSRGNVYPCNQYLLSLGNIREKAFRDIWANSNLLYDLRSQRVSDLDECSKCELFAFCTRCPGSAYLEDGSITACSKVAKELAQSRKRCGVYPAVSSVFVPRGSKEVT